MPARRVAVIGGGWAGLAAAVAGVRAGHAVSLLEMAPQLGGRARTIDSHGLPLDNGQHILIGAYAECLSLMATLGVDPAAALLRTPLRITYPEGSGLQMQPGPALAAFTRAVAGYPGWGLADKWALLRTAGGWALKGFRCDPTWTVSRLTRQLPRAVQTDLLDPLCVAALNTPPDQASATVFLRVLRDALFSGPGSADLLLPRTRLGDLVPEPAARWLAQAGATLQLSTRVERIEQDGAQWRVDGAPHDGVVLACTAAEAGRLASSLNPEWAALARGLRYEPIVTVYAEAHGTRLPQPMMALHADDAHPAQFVFDLGALCGMPGVLAFVISGAAAWVERGSTATLSATLAQARIALGAHLAGPVNGLRTVTEKRATFLCTPGLARPGAMVLPGLVAAGDYIDGPYPATLEGAVRSGQAAVAMLG